ncbi:helix-turn-helix domain-containing protein [Microbacterium resistens]|uniref:helix-turn-helix domain-containing protein n=1 Tax=Microbacterium resistens TaxID=156977 RepID=UPI00366CD75F
MNDATDAATIHTIAVFRDGLLDRLKVQAGIKSDDAFARLIGVSRATLARYKAGDEVSMRAAVGVASAFGLGLGEVVEMRPVAEPVLAVPA